MTRKTPGVYIVEKSAFPNSVVQVETAVPAFVGYTQKAVNGNAPLHMVPRRITSLLEFVAYFGEADRQVFEIKDTAPESVFPVASYEANSNTRYLVPTRPSFCLFGAMRAFFENGGGACYVVSVGDYEAEAIEPHALLDGIKTLKKEPEVTLLVAPETTRLAAEESATVHQAMLAHCGGDMKNRLAILDVHQGHLPLDAKPVAPIDAFSAGIGTNFLDFGAGYYPWLAFTVFQSRDFTFEAIAAGSRNRFVTDLLQSLGTPHREVATEIERMVPQDLLDEDRLKTYMDDGWTPMETAVLAGDGFAFADEDAIQLLNPMGMVLDGPIYVSKQGVWRLTGSGQAFTMQFFPATSFTGKASIDLLVQRRSFEDGGQNAPETRTLSHTVGSSQIDTIDKTARVICPLYANVMDAVCAAANALPPGAAMAGIFNATDNARGVWKAPANVSVGAVTAPLVMLDYDAQEDSNVSITGKSVNAIRPFVGEGTLVWGARTLDGNSLDWRYINVRRTMIMIEESIRLATKAYVFEPNTAQTWVTIRSMIENFLTNVWKQGGIAGAVPADAFSVHVGLGSTMEPVDVLDGVLRVTVLVAVVRPAEFIEITFQQQMQKS